MPKIIDIPAQRQMIANATINVISEAGLDGVRLRDVASSANVTTGAVTHYFDGKDAVLEEALEEIVQRTLQRINTSRVEADSYDDIEVFMGRACNYLPIDDERRKEWRVWLAFWGRAIADERLREVHKRYYAEFVSSLIRSLKQLSLAGSKSTHKQVSKCVDAMIAAIDVGTRATLEPGHWSTRRQRETLISILRPMLTAFVGG